MSYNDQTLSHHGIKGQKWGVRRFQKKDGSLTSAGKSRYGDAADKVSKTVKNLDAAGQTKVGDGLYSKSSHKGQLSDGYQRHKKPAPVMGGPNDPDNHGLGDTTKRAANRQQMKARNQDQARNLAKYAVERANARKSIENPVKRATQMVKDSYNMPCLSMTGKYSKYGKEVAKGALIGWAASVAVVGLLDHYT